MDEKRAAALVVARKGSLRDGLVALLDAMPQIGPVEAAVSLDEAICGTAPGWPYSLVLLDGMVASDSTWLAVRRVKEYWPGSRCIVLTEIAAQQVEADAAGADAVLANGFPAARLVAAIVRLLPHTADGEPVPASLRNKRQSVSRTGPVTAHVSEVLSGATGISSASPLEGAGEGSTGGQKPSLRP